MIKMRLIVSIVLGVWLFPADGLAQFTETKEIHKSFKVTPETNIEISNKYGKVEINTWDKDSVIFLIKIRVEEKKLSKLEKSIEEIDFDFTDSQHFLIARTSLGRSKSTLEKEFLKFKETMLKSDGNKEIDYTVWMPATNDLKVENKFGDVFIGDFEGNVEINLSNGNLKSHNFSGNVKLTLNFSDATINTMQSGMLDCSFSELYIKEAESIKLNSKSSGFEIAKIKDLNADSRRDKFKIRLIDRIEARGSFSNFRINELSDRLSVWADYGDIDIEKTPTDFSDIFIESKSTDINLYFNEEANFDFEITHSKTEVDLCREAEITDEINLSEKEQKVKLIGSFGAKSDNKTKVHINANAGEINILSNY